MILTSAPKRIKAIKFAFLSPEEMRKMSATKIITADTYDDDGFPIDMGLMDRRLGVIEPGLRCQTCGRKVDECPGHFGHIDLAMPVIHVGYTKEIKMLLKSTCRACGRILMSDTEARDWLDRIDRRQKVAEAFYEDDSWFDMIRESIKATVCPHCGEEQRKITLDKPTTFRENGHKLTPKEVRERLERIPDNDLTILGINSRLVRPEWLVLTVLPVPPVTVRPSITLESGDRSEDDLTHKLVDVLRINQRLQENRDNGAPQLIVEDLWELLQYHITTYFDNQTSGIPPARHRSGRPLKTLAQRLKGKEGRFRSNLSGKRVNFSARTVISPDPLLSVNEVGVPIAAAMELSVPVRVTPYNLDFCRDLVMNGADTYPGVNYVIRPDGHRIKITNRNKETVMRALDTGFKLERHLIDGDIVLFNRQPSLHRMSMMAHEVRVMQGRTFRLNLCVCPPYNADFDGDEMNLHVLQSEEARAEAMILMRAQEHILSPRFGGPVMGAIHDHVTGMFLLTHNDRAFTRREVTKLLYGITVPGRLRGMALPEPEIPPSNEHPEGLWTGRQLVSQYIPESINIEYRASVCRHCDTCLRRECPYSAYVVVENGKVLMGTIDGNGVGAFKGRILERITRDLGSEAGREFLDNITKLAIETITHLGFTTGIDDEDIPEDAKRNISAVMDQAEAEVSGLVDAFNKGMLDPLPGRTLEETLEVEAMRVLGKARDKAGEIAGMHLGLENSAVIMAKSGARGSMLNLSQMAGCIGQQAVRGERINRGYDSRTLPHFKRNDRGANAKGFVRASYKSGLHPTEYFFHSMGGREGLVDTAVRTSRSGYMQRRLINALEDLKVNYDGTVRNTADIIIQFNYGEDGIDPTRSVRGKGVDIDTIISDFLGPSEEVPPDMDYGPIYDEGLPDLEEEEFEPEPEVE